MTAKNRSHCFRPRHASICPPCKPPAIRE
jgi:hypothetical protein